MIMTSHHLNPNAMTRVTVSHTYPHDANMIKQYPLAVSEISMSPNTELYQSYYLAISGSIKTAVSRDILPEVLNPT